MIKNKNRVGTIFVALLLVSIAFIPAVMAQADSQNIDASKDVKVLKDKSDEKIVSFVDKNGATQYGIAWKDQKDPNRVNFAIVSQTDLAKNLKSTTKLSSATISDSLVVSTLSTVRYNFWHGSYVTFTGDTSTGTIFFHITAPDVALIIGGGPSIASKLIGLLFQISKINIIAQALTAITMVIYWHEQNSDGSINIKIPLTYVQPTLGLVTMLIGSHWYKIHY